MKQRFIVFIIAILFFFTSCRHQETYDFMNAVDEIAEISIVALSFDEEQALVETNVQKIVDTNAFLNEFGDIACYTYSGDPAGVTPEGVEDTVIKISYTNEEYELINWNGQAKYTLERGFIYYSGYHVFDKDQFESFITKYST